MQEVSKAIRNLAQANDVIITLQENDELTKIVLEKFLDADPFTQENILETVSYACKIDESQYHFRENFAKND